MKKWLLKIGNSYWIGFLVFMVAICFSTITQALFQGYFVLFHIFVMMLGVGISCILLYFVNPKKLKGLDASSKKEVESSQLCIFLGIVAFCILLNISLLNEETFEMANMYLDNATNYDIKVIQTIPPMLRDVIYSSCAMLLSKEVVQSTPNVFISYLRDIEIVHFAIEDLFVIQTLGCLFFILFIGSSFLKLQNYCKMSSI